MNPLDRCDREIAEIHARAEREPDTHHAYLFVLGECDWLREMDLIRAEGE